MTPVQTPSDVAHARPRVGLGLPVFNGENYLAETLESILSQSFRDFELLVSDNASEDRTAEICKFYADRDARVRYVRQPRNLGAAANYDFVFHNSQGEYFKWCAHDDLLGDRFLESCVAWLDAHPDYVGALPADVRLIKGSGRVFRKISFDLDPDGAGPGQRFAHYLEQGRINCSSFFSLFRRADLGQSQLHGTYLSSDRVLVGEMLLRGRLAAVEGGSFRFRKHKEQYSTLMMRKKGQDDCLTWIDPQQTGKRTARHLRYYRELLRAVGRVGPGWTDRLRACSAVIRLAWSERAEVVKELCFPLFRNGKPTPFGTWIMRTFGSGRA